MSGWGHAEKWERGRSVLHGLKMRMVATLGLLVGGLVWILLYAAFWAGRFNWFQNLAIIGSTLLVVPVVVVAMWVAWGISVGRRMRSWVDDRFDL
jgi:ABC-type tungstate transport system substrate-binding protein